MSPTSRASASDSVRARANRRMTVTSLHTALAIQWRRSPTLSCGWPALTQNAIASAHAFCHCAANCIQNCKGFVAAIWKAPAFGQLPAGLTLGKDFSFDSIADGEPVIGFGDLICCSQASII